VSLKFYKMVYDVEQQNGQYMSQLQYSSVKCPALFLYAVDDKVVNYKLVEQFIDRQKQRGIKVFTKRWDNSVHIQHLRLHPEEYKTEIKKFIQICLNSFADGKQGISGFVASTNSSPIKTLSNLRAKL